ncbi:MAG TPA: hypothetical protein VJK09_03085 [Candidatus Paceibacterota bacterium]
MANGKCEDMQTRILNLKGTLYEGQAKFVNTQTQSGEITILPGHRPIISVLKENSRIYLNDEKDKRSDYEVKGGFLHLDDQGSLNIMVD